eukprot:1157507-Pelagomonas_calceolata.AAC.3
MQATGISAGHSFDEDNRSLRRMQRRTIGVSGESSSAGYKEDTRILWRVLCPPPKINSDQHYCIHQSNADQTPKSKN